VGPMRLVPLIAAASLALPAGALAAKSVGWGPDVKFARLVAAGVDKASPGTQTIEDSCAKPLLPPHTGMTIDVPSEDCLLVARGPDGTVGCMEIQWQTGGPVLQPLPCATVYKALRRVAKPGWIVHYRTHIEA